MKTGQLVLVSVSAGIGCAILATIIVAIADLYVVGHGGASLGRTWIELKPVLSLSQADAFILAAAAATILATFLLGRRQT